MAQLEDTSRHEPAAAARPRAHPRARDAWFLLIAAAVVGLDQLTKWLISSNIEPGTHWPGDWPVRLVHITNTGAAFGMLQDSGPLLAITSLIGMAAILIYLFNPGFAHPLMRAGLALMLGGAVGNLIDRVRSGEVVDFIKFPEFPAFNAADSAITIGVVVLLATMFFEGQGNRAQGTPR
jgi:signal peptidase II